MMVGSFLRKSLNKLFRPTPGQDPNSTFDAKKRNLLFNKNTAITGLILKSFFRTFRYVFFAFFQPVILFAIFFFIFTSGQFAGKIKTAGIISGYIALGSISCSLFAFALMLASWKESILLKRISAVGISNHRFFFVLILVFLILSFLAFLWLLAVAASLVAIKHAADPGGKDAESVQTTFQTFNWSYLFLAFFMVVLTCNSFALIAVGLSDSLIKTQIIVTLFFFPSVFLGGIILPANLIDQTKGLRWVGYFIAPLKWEGYILNRATGAFPPKSQITGENIGNITAIWEPIVIGFGIILVFMSIASKTFSWNHKDSRKHFFFLNKFKKHIKN